MVGLVAGAAVVGLPGRAAAQTPLIGSDIPAAIVTFPIVRVSGDPVTDTYIQLANTSQTDVRAAQCFYINGLGSCSTSGAACLVNFDCPGGLAGEQCIPNWVENNFFIDFTPQQPLGWQASTGLTFLPCDPTQIGQGSQPTCGTGNDSNGQGGVPSVDAPFVGFLTCVSIEAINDQTPSPTNDLIGTATVITADPLDTYTYNGIGIQSNGVQTADNHLCLGGAADTTCPDAEYASCPQTLILNHLFDGEGPGIAVQTRLSLIPCTQLEAPRPDHQAPDVVPTTAQFLIFNEFEQKTSTSTRVSCYTDLLLSDIDTRPSFPGDNTNSVFSLAVQGTFGGQTRIRGVSTTEGDVGHGLLGVAVQRIVFELPTRQALGVSSSAVNLNFSGVRAQPDVICTAPGACEANEP
jgi:hypothetical protein